MCVPDLDLYQMPHTFLYQSELIINIQTFSSVH